jgi:Abortive infection alpha
MSDPNKALEGAITGVAKEAYSDLIRPSASPIGEALSGIIKAIVFYPRFWAKALDISLDEKTDRFKRNLEEKANRIPVGNRILPAPSILGPSIQALEYAVIDNEISDLFSNLIASSMDSRIATHPSFVEMIKQMTSDEAKILKFLNLEGSQPKVDVREFELDAHSYVYRIRNFSYISEDADCSSLNFSSGYLENLSRLGLIEISTKFLAEETLYKKLVLWFEKEKEKTEGSVRLVLDKGYVGLTTLGEQFMSVCSDEGVSK